MADITPEELGSELFGTTTKPTDEQSPDYSDMGELERSLKQTGQLYANIVCAQHPDQVLSGRHRQALGYGKAATIDVDSYARKWKVSHHMAELIIRSHSNVQRRVSKAERKDELTAMAQELEAQGTPKHQVSTELPKWSPCSDRWIRELLPDEYKQEQFNRFEKSAEVIPPNPTKTKPSQEPNEPRAEDKAKPDPDQVLQDLRQARDAVATFKYGSLHTPKMIPLSELASDLIETSERQEEADSLLDEMHDRIAKIRGLGCKSSRS